MDLNTIKMIAANLRPETIAAASSTVARSWAKVIQAERGAVPFGVAAVQVWCAGGGDPSSPWPCPQATAARLDILHYAPPRYQIWAGLRTINEIASILQTSYSVEMADESFWISVIQAYRIGVPAFDKALSLAKTARASSLREWAVGAEEQELLRVGIKPEGLAYKLITSEAQVKAGQGLAPIIPTTQCSKILERPDCRLRKAVAIGAGLAHLAGSGVTGALLARLG